MSSKCDAIMKEKKLPKDVFLELKQSQSITCSNFVGFDIELHETHFMFLSMKIRFLTICLGVLSEVK